MRQYAAMAKPVTEIDLDDHQQAVARYYRECWNDYRFLWMGHKALGLHFGTWDETTKTHAQSLLRTNAVMADAVAIGPGDRVLDAGCGVGGSSIWLAENRGAEVVGVNVSPEQVGVARGYVKKRNLDDRVRVLHRDYKATGFPDASFDVVWACESVAHSPDQRDFLREAFRVLKPGGRMIVRDVYELRPAATQEEQGWTQIWYDAWAMCPLPTPERFLTWVSQAGFTEVHMADVTASAVRSGRRLYWMCMAALPGATVLNRLHIRSDVQHTNVTGSIAAWRGYRAGLWMAGHTSARRPTE